MNETIENLKTVRHIRGKLLASWNQCYAKFEEVCAAEPTEVAEIVLQTGVIQEGLHTLLTIAESIASADLIIEAAEDEIYHAAGEAALAAVA